ncbi:MAG: sigma 54-interacting transcriptional regulator [Nitrospinae bacterium]|nr:sigma 54-interacting transcriptional regulator [Nitrospinota bacterium]
MKYLEYAFVPELDGLFLVNKEQGLGLFNASSEELFDLAQEEIQEKALQALTNFKASLETESGNGAETFFKDIPWKRKIDVFSQNTGKKISVEVVYIPIFDWKNRNVVSVLGVFKDLSRARKPESPQEKLGNLRNELEAQFDFSGIVAVSPKMLDALKQAGEVARQSATVMLLGESGTGKELLAKAIHKNSPRSAKPFVAINCSAFPDTLIESELFGFEKGAFTGADKPKVGKVQLADQGTLFLDEVTEMSASAQAKILRVIQEREFEPLGGVKTIRVNIRIIAATNKNIEQWVADGGFRKDLYYRLFVYPIQIPPLRERRDDIPALIDFFIPKLNEKTGKKIIDISPQAGKILACYRWPGNIRELQNVLERMTILAQGPRLEVSDVPGYLTQDPLRNIGYMSEMESIPEGFTLEKYMQLFEATVIIHALKKCAFDKGKTADMLGLSLAQFKYKLSKVRGNAKRYFCRNFLTALCTHCAETSPESCESRSLAQCTIASEFL